MSRGTVVLLAAAFVAASGTAAGSSTALPPGFDVVATASLYRGVDYVKLARHKSPAVVAHVAHVAPGAPVDLRVVSANDKVSTGTRELEATSSMCSRVRCVVGVNGDFHKAGTPAGALIVDRRMLHSPDPSRPQLTMTGDGRLTAGPLAWSGSVSGGGVELAVGAVNADPPADGLALYTPAYGARTDASTRAELVVRAPGGVGVLNQHTPLEFKGFRTGGGAIPADGAVLSADGAAARRLRDLWAERRSAPSTGAELVISSPVDAVVSLGAEPVVLRNGRRALPWRDPNLINPRQPHTLVGWNKTGDIYLVAVDGRQPGSDGMTMAEAADFLLALGVTDAVNLDGGGGTTFVAGGSVWNRPSDNDPARPAEYEERGSANALVVMGRPGAPLPPAAPPAPTPRPPAPGGAPARGGGGPGSGPGASAPVDGTDGGLFGPVVGVGGPPAPGELPLGPASAARFRSGPGGPADGVESAAGGSQETPGDGAASVADATRGPGAGEETTTEGATPAAARTLPRGPDGGGRGPILGGAVALAVVAAGAAALAAAGLNRCRRRSSDGPSR